MRIYWYWPHPHRFASRLALGALRPGDWLTVQALPSLRGEVFGPVAEYEVVRDLPDPTQRPSTRFHRLLRPMLLTTKRRRARSIVLNRGFDLAHLHLLTYQTDWIGLSGVAAKANLVSTVHDVWPHSSRLSKSLQWRLLHQMYAAAGHLVIFHEVLAQELEGEFGVGADRLHVVPHPVEGVDQRDPTVRRHHRRPMILLFGSLRPNKGIHVLMDAAEMAGSELDAEIVIAGAGSASATASIRARAASLDKVILELGPVSSLRKRELFSSAACVVLPYTSFHSQSGVLADAYSYRVPLVVSDVGAIGPTVRDDRTGWVVPPGEAAELARALRLAVETDSAPYRARLEELARSRDHQVVGGRLREIYDSALT